MKEYGGVIAFFGCLGMMWVAAELLPDTPRTSAPTDPKVFVSCEVSRQAIAAADKIYTGYMDSEVELNTDINFGRRAYTSTTMHTQADLLRGKEEAKERYFQLLQTSAQHGCP